MGVEVVGLPNIWLERTGSAGRSALRWADRRDLEEAE
jgi:hypothetical protein